MSSYAVRGTNYIFQVKFFDSLGGTVTVNTPSIEIYTFESNGAKVVLNTGNMTELVNDTGRWVYAYSVPSAYTYQPVFYGLISATDPADNSVLRTEQEVAVLQENNGFGFISVPPPPSYSSHWNTADGDNGSQTVSESITPTETVRIPTPSGGDGNPFKVGAFANTNQRATTSNTATFTTSSATTGFGGDSTMTVVIYDNDDVVLETFTTPAITQNATHTSVSGAISVEITQYGIDDGSKYKAKASIETDVTALLPNGGFYYVTATHTTDSTSDNGGTYPYTQSKIFLDTNPSTPSIGTIILTESAPVFKYLSGVKYYINGSTWRIRLSQINDLNENSIRTGSNVQIDSSGYSLGSLNHSPFGTGSQYFSNWTSAENSTNVSYDKTDWTLSAGNSYRYIGTNASVSATASDPWNTSPSVSNGNNPILIDTYSSSVATDTYEPFRDESRRQDSTFNGGNSAGNWSSSTALTNGEALIQDGKLMIASSASYTNWTTFSPSGNPDYTGFSNNADYYRTFVDSSGLNQPNFTMVISGSFVTNLISDLSNSLLEIFIRRVNSPTGGFGNTANPLTLHGSEYNGSLFDDGLTNGSIRLGTSSGTTIQGTFGGFPCINGVFIHIRINDTRIKLDTVSITFPN